MPDFKEKSFLAMLFEKKAAVIKSGEESGRSTQAAAKEAERQISQALRGGDPIKGQGVTKSGQED